MDQGRTVRSKEILYLLGQDKSCNTIAAEVGCSKSNVNYYAKKLRATKKPRIYDWTVIRSGSDGAVLPQV